MNRMTYLNFFSRCSIIATPRQHRGNRHRALHKHLYQRIFVLSCCCWSDCISAELLVCKTFSSSTCVQSSSLYKLFNPVCILQVVFLLLLFLVFPFLFLFSLSALHISYNTVHVKCALSSKPCIGQGNVTSRLL